ncbi:ABC transporter substrate-binding protein [Haladaptatus sp. DJG-WS-42]|uniref:ABC transporter substrate-binding protein n=1 Tax=Haladaptatus sp. DJG-WS-42 TaxID=3120516 RepID=UPI0030D5C581
MRIVSLLPAATELCYALGAEPVGVSHECDFPPAARDQPSVVRSRVDASADSETIDAQVQTALEAHGSVYELDREKLRELDPDYILTQGVCDVCAVDTELVAATVRDLELDAELVTTDVHSLADLYRDLQNLGETIGKEQTAARVVADLKARVAAVERRANECPATPSVAVLDWLSPVMVAGHWMPELVDLAGGTYPLAAPRDQSTPREWQEIRACDPDVLVAAPCGFSLAQAQEDAQILPEKSGWCDLTAVSGNRASVMDGHHLVNRPGPRLVDTLEQLACVLHPDEFGEPDRAFVAGLSGAMPTQ